MFTLEHSNYLQLDVSRVSLGFLVDISWVSQGCLKDFSRVLLGHSKSVPRVFERSFEAVQMMFHLISKFSFLNENPHASVDFQEFVNITELHGYRSA